MTEPPVRRKMVKPVRIGMYIHIREVLDAALLSGGGVYDAGSYGQAVHWRHEAYKFRKLFAETQSQANSIYDKLILRGVAKGETKVRIDIRKSEGTFTPNQPDLPTDDENDELLNFAKKFSTDIL